MTSIEIWALAAVALFLKTFATALTQGVVRIKNNAYAKPEDAAVFGGGKEALAADLPMVQQAQNALRNDGENIPLFLAVGLAYALLECPADYALILFGVFVVARYLHTALMIWPKQPWRTMSYTTGVLVMLILSGFVVHAALLR